MSERLIKDWATWDALCRRYGTVGEFDMYGAAIRLYHEDRILEAHDAVVSLGTGQQAFGLAWYRLMEAEAITRQNADRTQVNEWLEIEASPDIDFRHLSELAQTEAEEVARRLEFAQRPPVLLTILSEEANTPWTPNRQGFCVDMVPYEKICLPSYLLGNEAELREAIRHEYGHVVVMHSTLGRCPRWLDEAFAMAMGGEIDEVDARDFAKGNLEWLSPRDLDDSFGQDREDPQGRELVWLAYQQSAWIGRFLCERDGDHDLARLLRAFSNNSRWTDLRLLITGQEPADEALREVFGFGIEDLFRKTLEWLQRRYQA